MDIFHVIEAQQFNKKLLGELFDLADEMEKVVSRGGSDDLKGKILANLFYVPSTRTRLSFEAAMKRLGGYVISSENADVFSSEAKGGTLEDTIRVINGYCDVIVLRHYESGSARKAAEASNVPVINAGDGTAQHPTQALLDLYTIQRQLGGIDGVSIAMVGNLSRGRTVRSLCYLLAKYTGVRIYFIAPEVTRMKNDIKDYLSKNNVWFQEDCNIYPSLIDVSKSVDVIYLTHISKEDFEDRLDEYMETKKRLVIDKNILQVMRKDAIIMHPLPRIDEMTRDVDDDPRAIYFKQAKNGLFVRMALLKYILRKPII